jgi:cytochrome bd-type quinol oxidase subunit 2
MNTSERLFSKLAYGCAPLLAWAAHFTFVYGLVAAQCSPLLARAAPSAWMMWLASALAFAVCLLMLWRARSALRGHAALADVACAASALLALAGIAWTTLPLLLLDGCG